MCVRATKLLFTDLMGGLDSGVRGSSRALMDSLCVCGQAVFSTAVTGYLEPGVRGSSRAPKGCLRVAKLFSTALIGNLEPGVRASSRALMGWLCVWPSCFFRGFDLLPGAWRAWLFTSTDGLPVRVAILFVQCFDRLSGARRAWFFTCVYGQTVSLHGCDGHAGSWRAWFVASTDGLPVCVAKLLFQRL